MDDSIERECTITDVPNIILSNFSTIWVRISASPSVLLSVIEFDFCIAACDVNSTFAQFLFLSQVKLRVLLPSLMMSEEVGVVYATGSTHSSAGDSARFHFHALFMRDWNLPRILTTASPSPRFFFGYIRSHGRKIRKKWKFKTL